MPGTEVFLFTLIEDDAVVGDALDAGARGFVLKSEGNDIVVAAVTALANHRLFFSGAISERPVQSYLFTSRRIAGERLTPRKRSVIQLIAEGHTNQARGRIPNVKRQTLALPNLPVH